MILFSEEGSAVNQDVTSGSSENEGHDMLENRYSPLYAVQVQQIGTARSFSIRKQKYLKPDGAESFLFAGFWRFKVSRVSTIKLFSNERS